MHLEEERQLVETAQKDTAAFEKLYEYYFPKVYAFVASKVRDKATAEDLVSESFMKILLNLPKYEWRGLPFGAWVFRIARNILNDHYKAIPKNTVDIEEITPVKDETMEGAPDKKAAKNELKDHVAQVLNSLPPRESEVISLKFFSGLNNIEIAKALDLSESNVGVILYRTLAKIKPGLVGLI